MVFGSDSLFFSRPFPSAPVVKDHVVVIVKVGLCFGFFFLFRVVGTLVVFVVCHLIYTCRWLFGFRGSRTI